MNKSAPWKIKSNWGKIWIDHRLFQLVSPKFWLQRLHRSRLPAARRTTPVSRSYCSRHLVHWHAVACRLPCLSLQGEQTSVGANQHSQHLVLCHSGLLLMSPATRPVSGKWAKAGRVQTNTVDSDSDPTPCAGTLWGRVGCPAPLPANGKRAKVCWSMDANQHSRHLVPWQLSSG